VAGCAVSRAAFTLALAARMSKVPRTDKIYGIRLPNIEVEAQVPLRVFIGILCADVMRCKIR